MWYGPSLSSICVNFTLVIYSEFHPYFQTSSIWFIPPTKTLVPSQLHPCFIVSSIIKQFYHVATCMYDKFRLLSIFHSNTLIWFFVLKFPYDKIVSFIWSHFTHWNKQVHLSFQYHPWTMFHPCCHVFIHSITFKISLIALPSFSNFTFSNVSSFPFFTLFFFFSFYPSFHFSPSPFQRSPWQSFPMIGVFFHFYLSFYFLHAN